jgi:hypothetical protein
VANIIPRPNSSHQKFGLGLRSGQHGPSLEVSRVDEQSLFQGSLLRVGHRCRFIHGVPCHNFTGKKAAQLLRKSANNYTTIVTEPPPCEGIVFPENRFSRIDSAIKSFQFKSMFGMIATQYPK